MSRPGQAVFAYGSLVSRASVRETLGPDVADPVPARLAGWRRRWSLVRDNERSEKGFDPIEGEPFDWCLGLNLEPAPANPEAEWPNGGLIALDEPALERLRRREIRYDPVVVTDQVRGGGSRLDRILAFVAKPANYRATPPPRSVVIASYLRAVESAFDELGPGELDAFHATTGTPAVPVVEARLVRDEIPAGNPREW